MCNLSRGSFFLDLLVVFCYAGRIKYRNKRGGYDLHIIAAWHQREW
jgi:hypothetical protein